MELGTAPPWYYYPIQLNQTIVPDGRRTAKEKAGTFCYFDERGATRAQMMPAVVDVFYDTRPVRPTTLTLLRARARRHLFLRAVREKEAKAATAAAEWTIHVTHDDNVYFFNKKTGVTTWDRPAGVSLRDEKRGMPSAGARPSSQYMLDYDPAVAMYRRVSMLYPEQKWEFDEIPTAGNTTITKPMIQTWDRSWLEFDPMYLDELHARLVEDKVYTTQQLDKYDRSGGNTWYFRFWLDFGTHAMVFDQRKLDTLGAVGMAFDKKMKDEKQKLDRDDPDFRKNWRKLEKARGAKVAEFARATTLDYRISYGGNRGHNCLGCHQNQPCHGCGLKSPTDAFSSSAFTSETQSHTTVTKAGKTYPGRGPNFRCSSQYAPGLHVCNSCSATSLLWRKRQVGAYFTRRLKATEEEAAEAAAIEQQREQRGKKRKYRRGKLAAAPYVYPVFRPVTGPYQNICLQRLVFQGEKRVEEYDVIQKELSFVVKTVRWDKDPRIDDLYITPATYVVLKTEHPGAGQGKGKKKTNGCDKTHRKKLKRKRAEVQKSEDIKIETEAELIRDEQAFEVGVSWRDKVIQNSIIKFNQVHGTACYDKRSEMVTNLKRTLAGCDNEKELKAKKERLLVANEEHRVEMQLDSLQDLDSGHPETEERVCPEQQYVDAQDAAESSLEGRRGARAVLRGLDFDQKFRSATGHQRAKRLQEKKAKVHQKQREHMSPQRVEEAAAEGGDFEGGGGAYDLDF